MSAVAPRSAVAPSIDSASAAYWRGLADGQLLVPRCNSCGRHSFPPMGSCPHCGSLDIASVPVSGLGTIYSWATIHVALSPAFEADVPYTVLVVELEEGGRLMGRLLEDSSPRAGASVRFAPYRVGDVVLPGFRTSAPAEGQS